MVFSSLYFLFVFLFLNLIIYYLLPNIQWKNALLLVFSLVFYAFAGPKFLLILIGEVFISWIFTMLIGQTEDMGRAKLYLVVDLVLMLCLLCFFKYTNFVVENIQAVFKWPEEFTELVLPIGISFYTFQLISYTADVYRGEVAAQRNFFKLLLYASLFHQCIAGPIVRYRTVADDIDNRKIRLHDISEGAVRFSVGLAKKAVLANTCASILSDLIPSTAEQLNTTPVLSLWLGALLFTLQLYLDFSAYSDMAIGMGRMAGFHYDENFNYPLMSGSITEFWRRWHISLGSFFRDYVYIPLGGNRVPFGRMILNMFVVWALTGIWHGGSWNFLFWGLFHFAFLFIEKYFLLKVFDAMPKFLKWIQHIYAVTIVVIGFVIFNQDTLPCLGAYLKGMFFGFGRAFANIQTKSSFFGNIFFLVIAIISCFPIYKTLRGKLVRSSRISEGEIVTEELVAVKSRRQMILTVIDIITMVFCLLMSIIALVGDSYNPFLYFRF